MRLGHIMVNPQKEVSIVVISAQLSAVLIHPIISFRGREYRNLQSY